MGLAAIPIAATTVIAVIAVVIIEEDPAPEPAMAAEIAISSERTEIVKVGPVAHHVAAAYMPATMAAAAMTTALDKHKGSAIADGRLMLRSGNTRPCCGNRICHCGIHQQGQAESCRSSCYYSFFEHGVPFKERAQTFPSQDVRGSSDSALRF
jgi:hypothetical protein